MLKAELDDYDRLFLPGKSVLAYHAKYRWLPAHITEPDAIRPIGGFGAWPTRTVAWPAVGSSLAVRQELVLSVAPGGLAALLRELATLGDASLVQLLLELGVSGQTCDASANTALHLAAAGGHASVCNALIAATALPGGSEAVAKHLSTVPNMQGETPLRLAVQARATEARRVLKPASWASPEKLSFAAQNGLAAELRKLLEEAAGRGETSAACQHDSTGRSLLHLAAECGAAECIEMLLSHKADVN
eukprot:4256403-Prymnesium_polylepis.1